MNEKASAAEIRASFDRRVDEFSTDGGGDDAGGRRRELLASGAAAVNPRARRLLDLGCGGGNYALELVRRLPNLEVTLLDSSGAMLARAEERLRAASAAPVTAVQVDLREAEFAPDSFDIISAAAVLHHLRGDEEWRAVFAACHRWLTPGGGLWIDDLIAHEVPAVEALLSERFAAALERTAGAAERRRLMACIAEHDTPRSLVYQLDLLRAVGFSQVDVLVKEARFATFVAVKGAAAA